MKNVNDNSMWGNDRGLMQGQFHKIYIQRHENVRWLTPNTPSPSYYVVHSTLWKDQQI